MCPGAGGGEQARTKAGLPGMQGLACLATCLFVVFRVCLGGRPSPTHLFPNSCFNQGSPTLIRLCICCGVFKSETHGAN